MGLRERLEREKPQYIALWAVAVVCVGLGLAGMGVGGMKPADLSIVAAVAAALTTVYRDESDCNTA